MPYPTAEELRLYLRHPEPFTAEETAQAGLLLDLATGAVEEETGQSLDLATDTVLLDSTGTHTLILPRWPVTAITSVTLTEDGTVLPYGPRGFTWSAAGLLYRRGACWPCGPRAVEAVVTAGHAPVPRGVRAIVLRLAAAAFNNPGGRTQETLGDHSESWATPTDAGITLSAADIRTLSAYRART